MKSVGIDGCRSGWITVSSEMEVYKFDTIQNVINFYGDDCFYLIDMPIGLPDKENPVRACEKLMRLNLDKKRKSSVFGVPCREALLASNFDNANKINKLILGKGISKQSFFIFKKIQELDNVLLNNSNKIKIYESHPEIVFHFLNNEKSMIFSKKTENGIKERLEILEIFDKRVKMVYNSSLSKFLRKDVAKDDIIDAMSLAISGCKLPNRIIETMPSEIQYDSSGLQMAIYYNKAKH
ncbi:DUF429 domain-containing protein [Flavobacterium turcicum]|uniref:DUF429 domain-containing protein n=1 Tax=Flavobacterium turcicum TaxID=2764718 RepID=A0ABR7JEN1_9FLAO|nr:DUF429 domain-containing protein [Flavobacterium turcicum]MBC5862808.1 DUF429 domain-containing protein [Flavobacterium turcicum]NHL01540.1 DUF429 domain-containing protein [Flavobacterium turcicum]